MIEAARGRSDSTLVIVDDVCKRSPSFTVGRAIDYGVGAPPASAPKLAAGVAPSVPSGAVALVGDDPISTAEFKTWLGVATKSDTITNYDAGDVDACLAYRRARSASASDAERRRQCQREYEGLRDQVLQFLILERWIAGEAAADGLAPSAALLERHYREAQRDAFPDADDYRRFRSLSGLSVSKARFQVAFDTRYTMLREKAVLGVQAAPGITRELRKRRAKEADDRFNSALRRRWKAVTLCAGATSRTIAATQSGTQRGRRLRSASTRPACARSAERDTSPRRAAASSPSAACALLR